MSELDVRMILFFFFFKLQSFQLDARIELSVDDNNQIREDKQTCLSLQQPNFLWTGPRAFWILG